MFFNYLTLLTSLIISGIAIFYSVSGLAIIFAASAIPVIIMGTSLEIGKLIVAVWLHYNWRTSVWWLKGYLSVALVILMCLTAMGIFGFLSKSHIEQTASSNEQEAKIAAVKDNLLISNTKITRYRTEITNLVSGTNLRVDTLIQKEKVDLAELYKRMDAEKADMTKEK